MAYTKRTWLGRQGTGLNKFSIGGASPVTIVNQPDSVTQVGDALSAGNLNDLEDRIEDAFDDVDTALDTKADEQDVTNLNNALTAIDHRVSNLEQAKGDYVVSNYKDGSVTPSGKGNWAIVEGLRGVSRVDNNIVIDGTFAQGTTYASPYIPNYTQVSASDNVLTHTILPNGASHPYETGVDISTTPFDRTHSYLRCFSAKPSVACTIKCELGGGAMTESQSLTANAWNFVATIGIFAPYNNNMLLYPSITPTSMTVQYKDVFCVDLNVYFGTSDLSFLGATDSAKLATIQKDYPHLLTPSEYGVRIVDSSYSGVRAWGVNLFNPYAQQTTTYGTATISENGDTISITGTYYCLFALSLPVGAYHVRWTAGSGSIHLFRFQFEDGSISDSQGNNTTLTVTKKITGLLLYCASGTSATSVYNDVQIAYDDSPAKTTYHRYREPSTLSLTFTGKSAGSVSEMYFPETGEQTKPIGEYTITGSESFTAWGSCYQTQINSINGKSIGSYDMPNILLPSAVSDFRANLYDGIGSGKVSLNGNILYVSADIHTNWSNLVGKKIYYELATPDPSTFVTPIIDNTLLTESGGRMATVQTGTIVDGSFDMGFITL